MFFKPGEGFAVLGLHAKEGVGKLATALGTNLIDGTGFVDKKRAGGVCDVVVVFEGVYFPAVAQFFIEHLSFKVSLRVWGVDFEFASG